MGKTIKQQVIEYLQSEYSETQIDELIDQEICSGNWVDSEDLEENGGDYADEYEAYQELGRGEAEDAVRSQIEAEVLNHFKITLDDYFNQNNEEHLHETIQELYPKLDT